MRSRSSNLTVLFLAMGFQLMLPSFVHAQPVCTLETKLVSTDVQAGDQFSKVVLSGEYLFVGAPHDDSSGSAFSGAVYVFVRSGSQWIQTQKILASNASAFDNFGAQIAVHEDAMVISAQYWGPNEDARGTAYVFRFNGTSWVEEQILLASDGAAGDFFSTSVALHGELIVVGATGGNSDEGIRSGTVYLFRYDGTVWQQETELFADGGIEGSAFGGAVAVYGETTLLIGASGDDEMGTDAGSVHVFRDLGGVWIELEKFFASDIGPISQFGFPIVIENDLALIGASTDAGSGSNSGAAYVFRFGGSNWLEESKLLPDPPDSGAGPTQFFGKALALSENTALVGASQDSTLESFGGSAYLFERKNDIWSRSGKIYPIDPGAEDYFGGGVALSSDTLLVGAAYADDFGDSRAVSINS